MAKETLPICSQLKVQCVICKEAVFVQDFSGHIDCCGGDNREMQEAMKSRLEKILRNFTPIGQRKAKEPASNDHHPHVKGLRRGDSLLEPLRRGRSRTQLYDTSEKTPDSAASPWRVTETEVASSADQAAVPSKPNIDASSSDDSALLENRTLSCAKCSYTTYKKTRLQKHESRHRVTDLKILQCFYCSQRYSKGALSVHVAQVHPGLQFRFRTMEGAEVTRLACTKCSYKCLLKVQLKNHLRREHRDQPEDPRKKAIRKLTIVLNRENLEVVKRRLDLLRKAERVATTLEDHESEMCCPRQELQSTDTEASSDPPRARKRSISCPKCSAQFVTMHSLTVHLQTHLRQLTRKCSKCDFHSTSRLLLRHVKNSGHYRQRFRVWNSGPTKTSSENAKTPAHMHSKPVESAQVSSLMEMQNEPEKLTDDSEDCTSPVSAKAIYFKEELGDSTLESDDPEALHGDDEDEQLQIRCSLCSFVCTKTSIHKRHFSSHMRLSLPIFKCQFCQFSGTKYMFRGHQSRCAGYRTSNCAWKAPRETVMTCARCTFATSLPGELNAHLQNCAGENEASCD